MEENNFDSTNEEIVNQESNQEQKPAAQKTKYQRLVEISQKPQSRFLMAACAIFGFIFVCFIFVFQVILTPIGVIGASMQPTINVSAAGSDYSVNTDIVYYKEYNEYNNGDIVIIEGPYAHGATKIIKRVIAKPNQTIRFAVTHKKYEGLFTVLMNVNVYVDGVLLAENYIKEDMVIKRYKDYSENNYKEYYSFYDEFSKALDEDGEYIYTLGSDKYFCMGDNRNNSTDSRYFGAVDAKDIQGKVVIHVKHGESLFTVIWKRIFG